MKVAFMEAAGVDARPAVRTFGRMRLLTLIAIVVLTGCGADYACGWQRIDYDSAKDARKLEPEPGHCSMVVANAGNVVLPRHQDGCYADEHGATCVVLMPGDAVEIWHRGEWSGEADAGIAALNADGSCPLACQ